MEPKERLQFSTLPHRGVPLSTAFFLLTVCGVFARIAALSWQSDDFTSTYHSGQWLSVIVAGFIVFGFVGLIVGAFQSRPLSGMLIVAPTSAVLGGILAPSILLSDSKIDELFWTIVTGSTLLIVVAVLLRWLSPRTEELRTVSQSKI